MLFEVNSAMAKDIDPDDEFNSYQPCAGYNSAETLNIKNALALYRNPHIDSLLYVTVSQPPTIYEINILSQYDPYVV